MGKAISKEIIEQIPVLYARYGCQATVAKMLNISTSSVKKYLDLNSNQEQIEEIKQQMAKDKAEVAEYIKQLFHKEVSKRNWILLEEYRKKGITYKQTLQTLQYFYDIKHNSVAKANGSIGIVIYVYEEAKEYYTRIKQQQEKIANSLQKQLEKPTITINIKSSEINNKKRQTKKNKKIIDLQGIE